MEPLWWRYKDAEKGRTVVLNLRLIWRVDVLYVEPDKNNRPIYWKAFPELADAPGFSPDTIRYYRFYIGNETYEVPANPNYWLSEYLSRMYLSARE